MIASADIALRQRARTAWRRVADAVSPPPVILMYHRIAHDELDPWKLCVSPQNFTAQMAFIRRHRRPMRLAALLEQLERGKYPRGAVVVTFDDGYHDNLTSALPVLEAFDVPATVFCTAGYVGSDQTFWWDRLASLLLDPEPLPPVLTLDAGSEHKRIELGSATRYDAADRASDNRRHGDDDPANARLRFYREVWAWLRPLPDADRAAALEQLARWSTTEADNAPRPLTREQALTLAASPLIEIGAHSMTHAALSTLTPAAQHDEIAQSKAQLEALIGRPVTRFAYPFGDQSADTAALVRAAGFVSSCTTQANVIRAGADVFQLPRMAVGDGDANALAQTLRGPA